jgi:hypothetical protein
MESPTQTFLKLAFGPEAEGWICIAFLSTDGSGKKREMTERFFRYPDQMPEAAQAIDDGKYLSNVYYCPQLFQTARRRKDNVKACPTLWADLDNCPPSKLQVKPTILARTLPSPVESEPRSTAARC